MPDTENRRIAGLTPGSFAYQALALALYLIAALTCSTILIAILVVALCA